MKQKGVMFLLYAEISSELTLIAACTSNTINVGSELVDVTEKGALFRELLESTGTKTFDVKAQGICNDSASFKFLRQTVIDGTFFNARIKSDTNEEYAGVFKITSFESSGEYNKGELFAITLSSAGRTSLANSNFRLLESGGRRLLEDGSFRILEAA